MLLQTNYIALPLFYEDFLLALFIVFVLALLLLFSLNLRLHSEFHMLLAYDHYVCYRLSLPNRIIEFLWVYVLFSVSPILDIDLKLQQLHEKDLFDSSLQHQLSPGGILIYHRLSTSTILTFQNPTSQSSQYSLKRKINHCRTA